MFFCEIEKQFFRASPEQESISSATTFKRNFVARTNSSISCFSQQIGTLKITRCNKLFYILIYLLSSNYGHFSVCGSEDEKLHLPIDIESTNGEAAVYLRTSLL